MASTVEIYNMAISHLGVGKEITSLTEASEERRALSRFYEVALKAVLRDCPMAFSRRSVALGLVEEDPTSEWGYSYRYPSDCVALRRIVSGNPNETHDTRIRYEVASDVAGRLIYSNEQNAVLEYTSYVSDPTLFPDDFTLSFTYKLAELAAPRLAQGDPFGNRDKMERLYLAQISRARVNSFNEQQFETDLDSEFIRARS
jgi:hypothetical protein